MVEDQCMLELMKCSQNYRKKSVLKEFKQSHSNVAPVILCDRGSPLGHPCTIERALRPSYTKQTPRSRNNMCWFKNNNNNKGLVFERHYGIFTYFFPPLDYVHWSHGENGASLTYQTLSVSPGRADLFWVTWCKVFPKCLLPELWHGKGNTIDPETANE